MTLTESDTERVADRRHRRRQETIAEVIQIATEIMTEHGVAGLSLGEVARRLGIRTPSLYGYFPSKHALYDALFAHGAGLLLTHVRRFDADYRVQGRSLLEALGDVADMFVRWSVEHPAYSQLLFWRPVPGFTPSPEAYAPAVAILDLSRARLAAWQQLGLVRADVSVGHMQRDWTVLVSGVISQQLSNAPDESFATGRFTAALPTLTAMFADYYDAAAPHPSPHQE